MFGNELEPGWKDQIPAAAPFGFAGKRGGENG
jgi:hypothetical protein